MKEENGVCFFTEIGFAMRYRVWDEAAREWDRGTFATTATFAKTRTVAKTTRQDQRAGTLRGGSTMRMGFEPAVVSEPPSGPPG